MEKLELRSTFDSLEIDRCEMVEDECYSWFEEHLARFGRF